MGDVPYEEYRYIYSPTRPATPSIILTVDKISSLIQI